MKSRKKGKLIIFSAPSGSGKTTIVKELMKQVPNLAFSVSACSRPPRRGEVDGKDYFFISVEEFRKKIEEHAFVEWEEVYKDRLYGTLVAEVERMRNKGTHVLFDVDVLGGMNIKAVFGMAALSIFVQPPSVEELRSRLEMRGSDSKEDIDIRVEKAEFELTFAENFDVIVVNDRLDDAVKEVVTLVTEFLSE
ncbi:MAG: guanylate kinase [Bacteroidales bacterium]|nr:guanylate kinase [Bacteroidales bacterium]